MKKRSIRLAALLISALILAAGCGRASHYKAVGFAHSNTSSKASMRFRSFEGTMVFRLKCKNPGQDRLRCAGSLESGSVKVFYENGDDQAGLSAFGPGEELAEELPLEYAGTVTVIVTTDGACQNGDLRFTVVP